MCQTSINVRTEDAERFAEQNERVDTLAHYSAISMKSLQMIQMDIQANAARSYAIEHMSVGILAA